jgi:hypothetical protein
MNKPKYGFIGIFDKINFKESENRENNLKEEDEQ